MEDESSRFRSIRDPFYNTVLVRILPQAVFRGRFCQIFPPCHVRQRDLAYLLGVEREAVCAGIGNGSVTYHHCVLVFHLI